MREERAPLRAGIYLRISSDPEGKRIGVERQEADCRALCADYGYEVSDSHIYLDNDVSASTLSSAKRPQFDRLISAARAERIDVIVAFSTSRLTRKPVEWEALFELHKRHDTRVHLYRTGLLDLHKHTVRRQLRNDAAGDAYYAEEISANVTDASRHRAQRGEWHGGAVPYGFVRVGPKGEQGKLEHHPERAEIIREAARRILAGETLYAVVMDLNRRGSRTAPTTANPEGARWHARTLKRVLTSPNTAGVREYRGQQYDGQWDGILPRDQWERLRVVLNDEDRATRQSWLPAQKFLLSGLLRCELCGAKLVSNSSRGRSSFLCSPITNGCGKIRINLPQVEQFVIRQVLAVLDVPAVRAALSTKEEAADDEALRLAIKEDETRLQRVEDDFYDDANRDGKLLDRAGYLRQRDRIGDRLAENRRALAELQRTTFVVEVGDRTIRDAWEEHADDLGWQRSLLLHMVDRITVSAHPEGVASTLTRFRSETDEEFTERRSAHQRQVMSRRVLIGWKPERLPNIDVERLDMADFAHLSDAEKRRLWGSRMHAGLPVQTHDPARIADVTTLVRAALTDT
jgi:DNA invertase Pin-like site-specific DNA recombinase